MPTLGDLKDEIATDLVRDDIASGGASEAHLLAHINRAVRHYERENWWFLLTTVSVNTTASQNYITRPTGIERIIRVAIPALGVDLCKESIAALESYDEPTAQTGQPAAYAEFGANLRLWPEPAAVYAVKITGTEKLAALALDADSNVWTNEAYDLIAARTRFTLCRDLYRDLDGAASALAAMAEARQALVEQNIDRMDLPVAAGW